MSSLSDVDGTKLVTLLSIPAFFAAYTVLVLASWVPGNQDGRTKPSY